MSDRGYEVQVSVALVFDGEIVRCVGQVLAGSEAEMLRSFSALVSAMDTALSKLHESERALESQNSKEVGYGG